MKLRFSYSFSALETYLRCPKAFKFSRDPKTKKLGKTSMPALIGRAFHDFAAEYQIVSEKKGDYAIAAVDEMMAKAAKVHGIVEEHDLADLKFNVDLFVKKPPFGLGQKPIIEAKLGFVINDDGDLIPADDYFRCDFRGVVDRAWFPADGIVDGKPTTCVIVDWKTGRMDIDIDDDNAMQLPTYGWLAKSRWPSLEAVTGVLFKTREARVSGERTMRQEDFDRAKQWAIDTIGTIEEDQEFKATPGAHCSKLCDFCHMCPDLAEVAKRTLEEKVVAYAYAKAISDALKDDIKDHMLNGATVIHEIRVPSAGTAVELKEKSKSVSIEVLDLIRIVGGDKLAESDEVRAILPYLSVSSANIKPLLEDPGMGPELKAVATMKGGGPTLNIVSIPKELPCEPQPLTLPESTSSPAPTAGAESQPEPTSTIEPAAVGKKAGVEQDHGAHGLRRDPVNGVKTVAIIESKVMTSEEFKALPGKGIACSFCIPAKNLFLGEGRPAWFKPCPRCGGKGMPHMRRDGGELMPVGPKDVELLVAGGVPTLEDEGTPLGDNTADLKKVLRKKFSDRGLTKPGHQQKVLKHLFSKLTTRGLSSEQVRAAIAFLENVTEGQLSVLRGPMEAE
jgi:hypothetical protein